MSQRRDSVEKDRHREPHSQRHRDRSHDHKRDRSTDRNRSRDRDNSRDKYRNRHRKRYRSDSEDNNRKSSHNKRRKPSDERNHKFKEPIKAKNETYDPLKKEDKKQSLEDYIEELNRKHEQDHERLKGGPNTEGKLSNQYVPS